MLSVLHSQYHACWCSGDFRSQGINRHGIAPPEYSVSSIRRVKVISHMSVMASSSMTIGPFVQELVHANNKGNIETLHHGSQLIGCTGIWWIPGLDTNGCPLGNSKFILLSDNLNICLWLSAGQVEKIDQINNPWSTIYSFIRDRVKLTCSAPILEISICFIML